ncbi:three component ABC system middle component [Microtetraspora malaysiensis]|uniref:Three component ABC system middle component n=1 Tax=Microtetraspora malaysiensis TaxID=161358 RepID=A0ABW6SXB2_9ACTN
MPALDLLSREERNLHNPAFAGLLVVRAVQGHEQENGTGCHVLLAVLAPVMALTVPVRVVLPKSVSSTTVNWIERESAARVHLQQAAPFLGPLVREGLLLGLRAGVLMLDEQHLVRSTQRVPKRITGDTPEVAQIQRASLFLGRWLSRAGDLPTIFTLLGVRP